jgi:transcriptional regulator with XRE-family HTH domain
MDIFRNGNFIGRNVVKFRHRNNWTQAVLSAKLQLVGCCMARDIIANIENGHCAATERKIICFAEVFGEQVKAFFIQNRPS